MVHTTQAPKLSLAIIVPELLPVPPVKGGAVEHWVYEACSRMSQQAFDITVFSRPSETVESGHLRYVGIPWTRIERAFFWVKSHVSWRNPIRYLAKIQNVFSYGRRVAALVGNYDTVIVHNEPNLVMFLQKKLAQTLILHMHNDHLTHAAFRWMYRRALAKVDLVICVSDYIKTNAIRFYPQHAHKFVVLFNATDPEVFKPYGQASKSQIESLVTLDERNDYLLYVGRLTLEKGVDVLIRAFSEVLAQKPNARLIIAGSSFFQGAVKTRYQQHLIDLATPIHHAIHFTGFIPHDQLKYLYAAVDVVVLPSVWQDPCPLVALEAMASGTCLIATKVGGLPELVVNHVNGFLVEPNQVDALATTIHYVLNYPVARHHVEMEARKWILTGYAWPNLVDRLSNLIMQTHEKAH